MVKKATVARMHLHILFPTDPYPQVEYFWTA